MALLLARLEDMQRHVEEYGLGELYFHRDGTAFTILGGKAAFKGEVRGKREANALEAWLREHQGIEVDGWRELDALFGD